MNNTRTKIILQAFNKLDRTGDGKVTVEDLRGSALCSSLILNYLILKCWCKGVVAVERFSHTVETNVLQMQHARVDRNQLM